MRSWGGSLRRWRIWGNIPSTCTLKVNLNFNLKFVVAMAEFCSCFKVQVEGLPQLERALRGCGFTEPPQLVKERQVFGLSKELDDVWQLHIRGFEDGCLQAEVEMRWVYIEHASGSSRSGHPWLRDLLLAFGIPFREGDPPKSCLNPSLEPPQTLTEWKTLGVESLAKFIVKDSFPAKLSVKELTSFLQRKRLPLVSSMANLMRFLEFEVENGNLRIKVNCPIYRVYADWCERGCVSVISSLLGRLDEAVAFRRLCSRPESKVCLFEFHISGGGK